MANYEICAILREGLTREETKRALRSVVSLITSHDGVVRRLENMGEHDLPYRMRRHGFNCRKGRYMLFDILHVPKRVNELDKNLWLERDILRHTILKKGSFFKVSGELQAQARKTAAEQAGFIDKAVKRVPEKRPLSEEERITSNETADNTLTGETAV